MDLSKAQKFFVVVAIVAGLLYFNHRRSIVNPGSEFQIKSKVDVFLGDSEESLPMLILLHGAGADEDDLRPFVEELNIPLRAVFLRGPIGYSIGYSWWRAPNAAAGIQMVNRIASDIALAAENLASKYPTRGKPMLFGFSAGGEIAYFIAAKYPSSFSAIFPVAGQLQSLLRVGYADYVDANTKVYAFHGTRDSVISPSHGKSASDYIRSSIANTQFSTWPGGHSVPRQELAAKINETISSF